MFTRCPECETTFRLSAEDLRRAQGKVRCGDCGSVFNALEYLAEEPLDKASRANEREPDALEPVELRNSQSIDAAADISTDNIVAESSFSPTAASDEDVAFSEVEPDSEDLKEVTPEKFGFSPIVASPADETADAGTGQAADNLYADLNSEPDSMLTNEPDENLDISVIEHDKDNAFPPEEPSAEACLTDQTAVEADGIIDDVFAAAPSEVLTTAEYEATGADDTEQSGEVNELVTSPESSDDVSEDEWETFSYDSFDSNEDAQEPVSFTEDDYTVEEDEECGDQTDSILITSSDGEYPQEFQPNRIALHSTSPVIDGDDSGPANDNWPGDEDSDQPSFIATTAGQTTGDLAGVSAVAAEEIGVVVTVPDADEQESLSTFAQQEQSEDSASLTQQLHQAYIHGDSIEQESAELTLPEPAEATDDSASWSDVENNDPISAEPAIEDDFGAPLSADESAVDFLPPELGAPEDMPEETEVEFAAESQEVGAADESANAVSAAETEDDDIAVDFDDAMWERIPGVGSDEPVAAVLEDSLFAAPDNETDQDESEYSAVEIADEPYAEPPAEKNAGDDAQEPQLSADSGSEAIDELEAEGEAGFRDEFEPIDISSPDTLEFNAPEATWSSIFREDSAQYTAGPTLDSDTGEFLQAASPDDEPSDEFTLSNDDEWGHQEAAPSALAPEPTATADTNEDEVWDGTLTEWERAADSEELATESCDLERPAGTTEIMVEDSETPEMGNADEFSEDEYDVQHIVLADEADSAGLTQTFETAPQDEPPPWQAEKYDNVPEPKSRKGIWFAGGLILLTALALQLLHYNRDSLAASTAWGENVRNVYQAVGMDLYPEWSTASYEIRGSEAVAGESGENVMDIRAQIASIDGVATGLPYLRVVLRDRWSNPVAAKHFSPSEYATGSLPENGILMPNQTLAAHVSIMDPGSGAQGFELELCMPRRHTGLDCTGQPFSD